MKITRKENPTRKRPPISLQYGFRSAQEGTQTTWEDAETAQEGPSQDSPICTQYDPDPWGGAGVRVTLPLLLAFLVQTRGGAGARVSFP